MNKRYISIIGILVAIVGAFAAWAWYETSVGVVNRPPRAAVESDDAVASLLEVPEGFSIDVFAEDVPGARVMAFDPQARLVVSQTKEGSIVALEDADGDGEAEDRTVLATGLDDPHGIAFDCRTSPCMLYVAEHDALSRYPYDPSAPSLGAREELVELSASPADRHTTRSLLFLPAPEDDTLLVSVGSSCDVCEDSGMRGKIMAYDVGTGEIREYATGLRNAVFMTLHPVTGEAYATEMGRDGLGDDLPPDEINVIREGAWYGWPWLYGKNVRDESFRPGVMPGFAEEPVGSHVDIQAHSAPLGLAFVPENPPAGGWPEDYWYDLLVAYHGSWNRTVPTGYKVVRMAMDERGAYERTEDFITGWLTPEGERLGRPADVLALPGGVVYVSDDGRGAIYRLTRN